MFKSNDMQSPNLVKPPVKSAAVNSQPVANQIKPVSELPAAVNAVESKPIIGLPAAQKESEIKPIVKIKNKRGVVDLSVNKEANIILFANSVKASCVKSVPLSGLVTEYLQGVKQVVIDNKATPKIVLEVLNATFGLSVKRTMFMKAWNAAGLAATKNNNKGE
jgi:hypothetical protein